MSRQGEPRERTYENVRAFWEAEAVAIGNSPEVTMRDFYFRIHELHTLLPLIPRGARLLDAGCGTGFGTAVLARRARYALGIDYSPTMVGWANRMLADSAHRAHLSRTLSPLWELPEASEGTIKFRHADVLTLDLGEQAFDVVTAQRLLINLPTFEDQLAALRRLRSVVHDHGLLILGETTVQGYGRTDAYRARFGLPALERYWHNLYVDEERFVEWRDAGWRVEVVLGFDTYMFLSKVVYPAACGPATCAFLAGANAAAMEMACLFRTRVSAAEIGDEHLLRRYTDRVERYDPTAARAILRWTDGHARELPDWTRLGHQRLIVARPCSLSSSG
jgi:SAM-dependent methyltransferase